MNRTVFLSLPEPDEDDLKESTIPEEFEDGYLNIIFVIFYNRKLNILNINLCVNGKN